MLMLRFLTGSSERSLSAAPSLAVEARQSNISSAIQPDALLADDESLPKIRREDQIRLLVQSPTKLYLYWSFAHDPFMTLRRMFGDAARNYNVAVRLIDVESGAENLQLLAERASGAWLTVRAGRRFRADVGLYAPGRAFIKILSSNVVGTPRVGVSPRVHPEPEFRVSASEFTRTLSEAGYTNDAIEVWLEAADAATGARATRSIAQRFAGAEIPGFTEEDLTDLRQFIAALAVGISFDELRANLSPTFARWLDVARRNAPNDKFEHENLLQVLHTFFDFELEQETFGAIGERRSLAVAWTASDVRFPAPLSHVWLPSMTAGLLSRLVAPE